MTLQITGCVNFIFANCLPYGRPYQISMVEMAQMFQHVYRCTYHGNRVGDVFASDRCARISSTWLKNGVLKRNVFFNTFSWTFFRLYVKIVVFFFVYLKYALYSNYV